MVLSTETSVKHILTAADCIGQTCAVYLSSLDTRIYVGQVLAIKTKDVWLSGERVAQEWARVRIPTVGTRWIPAAWFVGWVWE